MGPFKKNKTKKTTQPEAKLLIQNKVELFWLKQNWDMRGSKDGSPSTEPQDSPATVLPPPPSTGRFSVKLMELKFLQGTLQGLVPHFISLILCCFYNEGPPNDTFHIKLRAK